MAQKKKSTKQNKKQPKQKQKQKQTQTQKQSVVVNINSVKKGKTGGKKRQASSSYPNVSQPLITTLPIQYTPYTMYDTSRLIGQENLPRNQIFEPTIPNAIPIMELAREPRRTPSITQQVATDTAQDDEFTEREINGYNENLRNLRDELEQEKERDFNMKTAQAMSKTYPTQQSLYRTSQSRTSLPEPVDNSIAIDEISGIIADTRKILQKSSKENRKIIDELETPPRGYGARGGTASSAYEEEEYKRDLSGSSDFEITGDNRYYCNLCNSSIINSRPSIASHKNSKKHKENLANSLMGIR